MLANVLGWAFDETLVTQEDEDFEVLREDLHRYLRDFVPAWNSVVSHLVAHSLPVVREELAAAFATIRELARDIARNEPGGVFPMALEVYVPLARHDKLEE